MLQCEPSVGNMQYPNRIVYDPSGTARRSYDVYLKETQILANGSTSRGCLARWSTCYSACIAFIDNFDWYLQGLQDCHIHSPDKNWYWVTAPTLESIVHPIATGRGRKFSEEPFFPFERPLKGLVFRQPSHSMIRSIRDTLQGWK